MYKGGEEAIILLGLEQEILSFELQSLGNNILGFFRCAEFDKGTALELWGLFIGLAKTHRQHLAMLGKELIDLILQL